MRLTFKATKHLEEYHGAKLDLLPGQSAEVEDATAARLLNEFPDNFVKGGSGPIGDRQITDPKGRKDRV